MVSNSFSFQKESVPKGAPLLDEPEAEVSENVLLGNVFHRL